MNPILEQMQTLPFLIACVVIVALALFGDFLMRRIRRRNKKIKELTLLIQEGIALEENILKKAQSMEKDLLKSDARCADLTRAFRKSNPLAAILLKDEPRLKSWLEGKKKTKKRAKAKI